MDTIQLITEISILKKKMDNAEAFLEELVEYLLVTCKDDDYITPEVICRKLAKYGYIELEDGYWVTPLADRKTEPQTERLCDKCEYYKSGEICGHPSIGEIDMGGKGDTFPYIKETPMWCPLKPQTSKIIEAYSKGFKDGAEAAKEVSSVVHGEWIDKGWHGDWQFETDGRGNCWYEYECSECGFRNIGSKSNYCPNCGAKMKERASDEKSLQRV